MKASDAMERGAGIPCAVIGCMETAKDGGRIQWGGDRSPDWPNEYDLCPEHFEQAVNGPFSVYRKPGGLLIKAVIMRDLLDSWPVPEV